ncbi:MAG TPA: hypothetical protein VJ828_19265 [Lacipirellulaceae bacterium]|nr:hypothetical protein [Lacipirellulaceae bacterium]
MRIQSLFVVRLGMLWIAASWAAPNLCAQNLVVHWTFDEAAGGTVPAVDTGAAPSSDGAFGATATRTSDTPGGGPGFAADLSAPGAASIVDGGNPIEVDTLAAFTFSTWAKVTGATHYNEGGSGNVRLLAKQSATTLFDGFSWNMNAPLTPPGSQDNFRMGLFIGGEINFAFSFATADIVDRGGDWLFLAVTYDGNSASENARFYVGDETTPVAQLGDPVTINAGRVFSSNTSNGGTADARFGVGFTDAAPTADTAITGFQDDVRVYDSVLDLAALDAVRLDNLPTVMGVTGDYNNNGAVDAADYVVWRKNEGTSNPLPNTAITSTPIGPEHYAEWRANFDRTGGAASVAAVPEPAAVSLLAISAWMLVAASRRETKACRGARKSQ